MKSPYPPPIRVEAAIDSYLQSTKKLEYHGILLPEDNRNRGTHYERERLCEKLL